MCILCDDIEIPFISGICKKCFDLYPSSFDKNNPYKKIFIIKCNKHGVFLGGSWNASCPSCNEEKRYTECKICKNIFRSEKRLDHIFDSINICDNCFSKLKGEGNKLSNCEIHGLYKVKSSENCPSCYNKMVYCNNPECKKELNFKIKENDDGIYYCSNKCSNIINNKTIISNNIKPGYCKRCSKFSYKRDTFGLCKNCRTYQCLKNITNNKKEGKCNACGNIVFKRNEFGLCNNCAKKQLENARGFNREEFYSDKLSLIKFNSLERETNLKDFDNYKGILGVWSRWTEDGICLDVCKSKDIGAEMLSSIRSFHSLINNPEQHLDEGWKRKYKNQLDDCNGKPIIFKIVSINCINDEEAINIEVQYAHDNKAKYWSPEPGQKL